MRQNYPPRLCPVVIVGFTLLCSLLSENGVVVGLKKLTSGAPNIKIQQWLEVGELDWQNVPPGSNNDLNTDLITVDVENDTFIFSQNIVGAIISCQASYPLQWTSNIGQRFPANYLMKGRSSRQSESVDDPSTFTYSADLLFQGQLADFTGKYTCHKAGDQRLAVSSSVYMFWEGLPPPYLLLAERSVIIEVSEDQDILELPCLTSLPDVDVFLFKSFFDMYYIENFEEIHTNSSIQFDPKIGFTLKVKQLQSPLGKYRCVTNSTERDHVEILVKNLEPGSRRGNGNQDVLDKNAQLIYDSTTESLICCSSGKNAPKIKSELCLDPFTCQIKGPSLNYTMDESKNTQTHFLLRQLFQSSSKGNCTYSKMYPGIMGHFQCIGEGINVMRTLYSTYPVGQNQTYQLYQTWQDINATNLIQITVNSVDNPILFYQKNYYNQAKNYKKGWKRLSKVNWSKLYRKVFFRPDHGKLPDKVFAGELVNFSCAANGYYFASGSKFYVRWKNSSLHQLTLNSKDQDAGQKRMAIVAYTFHKIAKATVTVRMDTEMDAIICYVPVYNSSDWVQKELALHVQAPTLPTILGGTEDEIMYWTLNDTDKILKCEATGMPIPTMMFQLNGKEVVNGSLTMVNNTRTGSLTIRIPEVAYETHGDYYCFASNLAGVVQKKVVIIVQERTHWTSIIAVSVVSVALVIILLLTAWKFQLQKKILAKLRRNTSLI